MIEFNDKYSFKRDDHQWVLHEKRKTMDPKTKEEKDSVRKTYHTNLVHVMNEILDRSMGKATSKSELLDALLETRKEIKEALTIQEK